MTFSEEAFINPYLAQPGRVIITRSDGEASNLDLEESYFEMHKLQQLITGKIKKAAWNTKEFLLPTHVLERMRVGMFGRTIPEGSNEMGAELVREIDDDFIDGQEIEGDLVDCPRFRFCYISDLVSECKQALPGVTKETGANRLVAHRWLSDRMRERGMRTRHIKSMLPLAIEAVFIPDKYEIEARALRQSLPVQNRVRLGTDELFARRSPWLLNWFGPRVRRSEPSSA